MTKEELEKEAEAKYKTGSYPQLHPEYFAFIHGYLAGAEPREKRIEELEEKIADIKANCDLAIEGRDIKIKELEKMSKLKKQQLTKATELLKKLILEVRGYEEINGYDTCEPVQEAEQFLKECK